MCIHIASECITKQSRVGEYQDMSKSSVNRLLKVALGSRGCDCPRESDAEASLGAFLGLIARSYNPMCDERRSRKTVLTLSRSGRKIHPSKPSKPSQAEPLVPWHSRGLACTGRESPFQVPQEVSLNPKPESLNPKPRRFNHFG